ncbi:MAG: peptidoglycan DD-metalloendopeptidase family protein [Vicinamibacterales bacterium]
MLRRSIGLWLALVSLGLASPRAQQPPPATEAGSVSQRAANRLRALRDEADRLAREERTVLGDLRRLEVERDIRAAELERARASLRTATDELSAVDADVARITAQTQAALPDLKARLVTVYKLGRGQYARLLLSASDVRQFTQALRLVSALAEQDRRRMGEFQRQLAELETARKAATERQAQVREAQAAAVRAQAAAQQAIDARNALVHDIDTRRDLNAQYAAELMAAQARLQESISGLSSTAATLPLTPFKGALDWPAAGTVSHPFGASVGGRPPLRGLEIVTSAGAAVRAIHEGTVAFADVFSGYGRLVILDHGNQTFSLYGNLAEITVSKGARVEGGAEIGRAAADEPGGPVLYFELRIDGRAVDPLQWLAKR